MNEAMSERLAGLEAEWIGYGQLPRDYLQFPISVFASIEMIEVENYLHMMFIDKFGRTRFTTRLT